MGKFPKPKKQSKKQVEVDQREAWDIEQGLALRPPEPSEMDKALAEVKKQRAKQGRK